ncbi:hypothetical protein AYO21_09534 [Fonsecaea monophora]|uniref:Uncharacterized protein n=1 Tax=Fonsecaea monophora TaxID=254056 RepID=A0A177EZ22_9EURO|nr:hypothetical protein AYO21_09534 [Fonsecaea monophora]OAG36292.1 hypothetical protein AYO21_09534 [Fonsecaea monophora]
MTQTSGTGPVAEEDRLRNAMYWPEDGEPVFHVDAYNFGKSLGPLLKNESSMDELVKFLQSYELYRSAERRVMRPLYTNRYMDAQEVQALVRKQKAAHDKAMTAEPGWQEAMKDAGIWDDDKETF